MQFSVLADLCAPICRQYNVAPAAIYGHRDSISTTACPGAKLYAMLPKLRQGVARKLESA